MPDVPDNRVIYITGLPEHNHYLYGQWTSEKEINWLLPLFYQNSFKVKFVDSKKFNDLLMEDPPKRNEMFLEFNNMKFHLLNSGYSKME